MKFLIFISLLTFFIEAYSDPFLNPKIVNTKIDKSNTNLTIPKIIQESSQIRIWHLKDQIFKKPEIFLYFKLSNPLRSSSLPNFAKSALFEAIIQARRVDSNFENGEKPGLSVFISSFYAGYSLKFKGIGEKMPDFVKAVFQTIVSSQLDHAEFLRIKRINFLKDMLKDRRKRSQLELTIAYSDLLQSNKKWTEEEILVILSDVTFEEMVTFIRNFFRRLHIEAFAYGNISKAGAVEISEDALGIIRKYFTTGPFFVSELERPRTIALPEGSQFLYRLSTEKFNESALQMIFQLEPVKNLKQDILQTLVCNLVWQLGLSPWQQSPTKQYGLYCNEKTNGMLTIEYYVQSGLLSPKLMQHKMEEDIKEQEKKLLRELDNEKFQSFLQNNIKRLTRKFEAVEEIASAYWKEIDNQQYFFDKDQAFYKEFTKISKNDLISYYKEILSANSQKCRKLVVHAYGSNVLKMEQDIIGMGKNVIEITNIKAFKDSLPLYGLPKAYRDVPPVGYGFSLQTENPA